MSWLNWPVTNSTRSGNPNFSAEAREEKRAKLEAARIEKLQKAAQRKKYFQAGISAPPSPTFSKADTLSENEEDETKSLPDIFLIAEGIFDDLIMADFETENGIDGEKAVSQINTIQCPFDKSDIEYWFSELELQLTLIEVKSQWLKRLAVQRFLPVEIREEVKDLLRLKQTEAGNDIYKRIKAELVELFGSKPEDAYLRAKNRVMTGKPSQLGKALISDICTKKKKLDGCCCSRIVWGMYRESLPVVVRNHVAEMEFNKDTYQSVFKKCDQVFVSNQNHPVQGAAVAATSVKPVQNQSLEAEVAAVRPPKKNKNQNQSGSGGTKSQPPKNQNSGGQQQGGSQQQGHKGPRHATAKGDSDKLCKIHYRWGNNGTYCAAPWKCPMKDVFRAPQ